MVIFTLAAPIRLVMRMTVKPPIICMRAGVISKPAIMESLPLLVSICFIIVAKSCWPSGTAMMSESLSFREK